MEVLQRPRGRQVPAAAAQLCVANTHLYSNPELPDVKLWQCNALLQELEGFVHSRQLPLLVRLIIRVCACVSVLLVRVVGATVGGRGIPIFAIVVLFVLSIRARLLHTPSHPCCTR